MSAPKILILGGTEFMGRSLIEKLKLFSDNEQSESI